MKRLRRILTIVLVVLSLFAVQAAPIVEADGPMILNDGKGWCRDCQAASDREAAKP